jgi:hypothetical protein
MDAKSFRERAMAAFPADPVPDEVVGELAREVHADAPLLEQTLRGRAWTALSQGALEERAKDIVALSVPAFLYYIPAFMCAAAVNPEGDAATYAMYALCPLGNFDTFDKTTCALFSGAQAGAIVAFLEGLRAEPSFGLFTEEMKPGLELWRRRSR